MVGLLDCPQEIIRYVLNYLKLTDLKNARLACKTLGVIGAETLLPTIHVVFTKQSIERLRDVSLHPVISLYVYGIMYEADRVDHYDQQEDWERDVVDSEYLTGLSPGIGRRIATHAARRSDEGVSWIFTEETR
jgi:hypothetical protein